MTSGWQPVDSQLARSKKFLPLMVGILERSLGILAGVPQYHVGEEVDCLSLTQKPKSMTKFGAMKYMFMMGTHF